MVIDGPGAAAVTISGGGAVEVFLAEPGAVTTLSGLTISGGNSQTNGGGILVEYDGTLTITNSTIVGNTTLGGGGGIFNERQLDGQRHHNRGQLGSLGGGILNYDLGILTVTGGSTIEDNTASDGGGGIGSYGTLTVSDGSTIEGNLGGGISSYGTGPTTIADSTIADNAMTGSGCCLAPASGPTAR